MATPTNSKTYKYLDYAGLQTFAKLISDKFTDTNSKFLPLTGGTLTGAIDLTNSPNADDKYKMGRTLLGSNSGGIHFKKSSSSANDWGNAITWGYDESNNTSAGIYVKNNGSYGSKMYLATTDVFNDGAKAALEIDSVGNIKALRKNFIGNLTGDAATATKATNDSNGNAFIGNYLRKVTVSKTEANDFNTFENMTLTGRGDPTSSSPALINAPWTGSGPDGGYGVLTYLWSDYGTQMAWGYNSNKIYIRYKNYSSGVKWSSTWDSLALTSDIPTKVSQLTNDASYTTATGHNHSFLTGTEATLSATTRNLTTFPASKTLFTGYWGSSRGYATNYGTTLDISYSTWYQRLAFNTEGRIEYFKGINTNNADGTEATLSKVGDLAYTSDIPTETTVSGWGFTKNAGTVTGVKINGTTKSPSSGVVDLGTVITSHQDISGKQDKLTSGTNIKTINSTSILGSGNIAVGTYSKPSGGIPKSDLASAVQTSLGKADTALQSYTEQYRGTVTGVKINGTTKTPSSGVVDLGTVITTHQDISGKADKSSLAAVATSGSYNDLINKPTIPSAVTESTVSGWGFTKNTGNVTGPASSTTNSIALFDGTTGKVIKDSGYTIAKSVPSNAVFTDTNTKVTQTVTTGNSSYNVMMTSAADKTATTTDTARFASAFKYNPSTKALVGVDILSNPTIQIGDGSQTTDISFQTANLKLCAGGTGTSRVYLGQQNTTISNSHSPSIDVIGRNISLLSPTITMGESVLGDPATINIGTLYDDGIETYSPNIYTVAQTKNEKIGEYNLTLASGFNIDGGTNGVNITGNCYATAFYETSDENLKDFSSDVDVDFAKLKEIRKSYFTWKDNETGKTQIGTSAQDVQKVYPELVSEDNKGNLTVDYAKLSIIALSAIDKLDERLSKIEKSLNIIE